MVMRLPPRLAANKLLGRKFRRPFKPGARDPSLLDHLVCPRCRNRVQVVPDVVSDGHIKFGRILCALCEDSVGSIHDFKFDFREGAEASLPRPLRRLPAEGEVRIPARDERLTPVGGWWHDARGFLATEGAKTDRLDYRGRFTDAYVRFLTHSWAGMVDVLVDDVSVTTVDLFFDGWFVRPVRVALDLPFEEHTISIRPRETANAASRAMQVFVEELVLRAPRSTAFPEPRPLNKGNPYSDVIERYVEAVPPSGLVLEAGGGDRRRRRPGYVNFEYLPFELADFYGDMQRLPFADDTFALVLSQAVFEHVANPFEAAEELVRVTQPGGIILTEAAFMQPLHAAPYHYFNLTPWGAEELFKSCTIVEEGWFGELSFTVDWLLKSVGLLDKVPAERLQRIVDEIRELDALVSHEELRAAASAVYVVARKP
jgi:SAM-dependent methyltransferase